MKRYLELIWPLVGLVAVVVSLWFLAQEFKGESVAAGVWAQLRSISPFDYLMAILSAVLAYAALAWYDRIALQHLGVRHIAFPFIALCSFTSYALSHTVGVTVFSGAVVRYRAYSTKGLSAAQIAVLVAVCSITFTLGTLLLGGAVLLIEPQELRIVANILPDSLTSVTAARGLGLFSLTLVAAYAAGSALRLKPLVIGGFRIEYPRPAIALRQFIAAPVELIGAAGIIYFALPSAGNPGFLAVMAIFLGSFSAALVSNAPAGAGVFDLLFINALPDIPKAKVLAAVLMFRLFYLLIPLIFAIVTVIVFERRRLSQMMHEEPKVSAPAAGSETA